MDRERGTWSGLSMIGITVFFLGCFLSLIVFGTTVYRSVAASHEANNERRSSLSYLLTVTRSNEAGIQVGTSSYGNVLMIADGNTGYGTRIYLYEGELVEEYGKLSRDLYPEGASVIINTEIFEIDEVREDLLKIRTDQGSVYIHRLGGDR